MADRLRELPWRQLVVLGDPGAGKSVLALMLVHQLLDNIIVREPVPVLLPVSSWNPSAESVTAFVARRLQDDFGLSYHVATRLLEEPRFGEEGRAGHWVVPVLDGLDEIRAEWHADAIAAVEAFAAEDRPVVVTCRFREFERAVSAAGILARAAVVRLEHLQPDDVIEFLSDPVSRRKLWRPVFDAVQERPAGVLARMLSTPLWAGLAKDTYANDDPGELAEFTSSQQIIDRLIDGYITSVHRPDNAGRGIEAKPAQSKYRAPEAARWLGNLAFLAYLDGTRDLRWWRLPWAELTTNPHRWRWLPGTVVSLAVAVTAGIAAYLISDWPHPMAVAFAFWLLTISCTSRMFDWVFAHQFQPRAPRTPKGLRWLIKVKGTTSSVEMAQLSTFGAVTGLTSGVLLNDPLIGLTAGIIAGLLSAYVPGKRWRPALSAPEETLRANHLHAVVAAIRHGVAGSAVFAASAQLFDRSPSAWAATGLAISAFGGALAGGHGLWLRFRIVHIVISRWPWGGGLLPARLIDFLEDGTRWERATIRVNGSAWQFRHTLIQDHLVTGARMTVVRRRADAGDGIAARQLGQLLREQGSIDEAVAVWRRCADAGDGIAARQLGQLLREQGSIDEAVAVWRRCADAGDGFAAMQLAHLLREQGRVVELCHLAELGDKDAARQLAHLLREQGNVDELRLRADAGDRYAAEQLAMLLHQQGNVDELRLRADAGDRFAAEQWAQLLCNQGNIDEAIAVWRRHTDAGDALASGPLAQLLREQGNVDELRRRSDAGDWSASEQLALLLREQGNVDELRLRADAGHRDAARLLGLLLCDQGEIEGAVAIWRRWDSLGDGFASAQLAHMLSKQGNVDELRRRADTGDSDSAVELAKLLSEQGNVDELRRRSDAGDTFASGPLARLLREQGKVDELRSLADADDGSAEQWEGPLREQSRVDGLHRRANAEYMNAAEQLAHLLREQGNVDELRLRADAGDRFAAEQWAQLLCNQGNIDEAIAVWRRHTDAGDALASGPLAQLLREQGNVDELRRRSDAGDWSASEQLALLLREQANTK